MKNTDSQQMNNITKGKYRETKNLTFLKIMFEVGKRKKEEDIVL